MDAKFLYGQSDNLSSVSITDGQIIALSDTGCMFYDIGGVRRSAYSLPTATSTSLGGVTLSDKYTTSGGTANAGVGASSYAVASAYSALSQTTQELLATGVVAAIHGSMATLTLGTLVKGSTMTAAQCTSALTALSNCTRPVCGYGIACFTNGSKYYPCIATWLGGAWAIYAIGCSAAGAAVAGGRVVITSLGTWSIEILTVPVIV